MHRSTAFEAFRCLKSAWALTARAPVALWGAGLVLIFVEGCSANYSSPGAPTDYNVQGNADGFDYSYSYWYNEWLQENPMLVAGVIVVAFLLSILFGAFIAWIRAGYYKGVKSVMQGRPVQFGDMYANSANWLPTFLAEIVRAVLLFLGMMCGLAALVIPAMLTGAAGGIIGGVLVLFLIIPVYIYIALGTTFMTRAAAIDGLGPMQALSRSWDLADGSRGDLILMHLLQFIMALVGVVCCCVGVFPAAILAEIMWVEAYVQATDDGTINLAGSRPRSQAPDTRQAEVMPDPEKEPEGESGEPGTFDPGAWRKDLDEPPTA
jgi:hypothetical protein